MLARSLTAAMRVSLSMNQVGLQAGKNGFSFSQAQPDRLRRGAVYRSAPRGHFVRPHAPVWLRQFQQNPPLHLMPQANNDPKSISPPGLRRSRRVDPDKNMARYYHMDVQPDLFGGWRFIREWGRIGRSGQMRQTVHTSQMEARAALERRCRVKEKRGYLSVI